MIWRPKTIKTYTYTTTSSLHHNYIVMISLVPMRPGYEARYHGNCIDDITEQNWRGWCIAHWFLVGVEEDNVLLEVSGRQSNRTHHHCQLRSHMMSHDMTASHHQPLHRQLFSPNYILLTSYSLMSIHHPYMALVPQTMPVY